MTAPTYPRINPTKPNMVLTSEAIGFFCSDTFEAHLALNALNAAFNAGMRHAIDMMKEQSDEADA